MIILTSIVTVGLPGSVTMVLQSVGLPLEEDDIVTGIDRILDMARTTVNITGDAACYISVDTVER